MSTFINVLVDTEQPLEEFAQVIEQLLHVSFKHETNPIDNQIVYTFIGERAGMWTGVWVCKHNFDNDGDLLFEDYPYVINIEVRRGQDPEGALSYEKEFGHQVFEMLKKTGKYRLMLVWDVQILLEQFDPANKQE